MQLLRRNKSTEIYKNHLKKSSKQNVAKSKKFEISSNLNCTIQWWGSILMGLLIAASSPTPTPQPGGVNHWGISWECKLCHEKSWRVAYFNILQPHHPLLKKRIKTIICNYMQKKSGKYMLMTMRTTKLKASKPTRHGLQNSTPVPTMLCQQCDDGGPVAVILNSFTQTHHLQDLQFHVYFYNVQQICKTLWKLQWQIDLT